MHLCCVSIDFVASSNFFVIYLLIYGEIPQIKKLSYVHCVRVHKTQIFKCSFLHDFVYVCVCVCEFMTWPSYY